MSGDWTAFFFGFFFGVVCGQTVCMGLFIVALLRMSDKIEKLEHDKE